MTKEEVQERVREITRKVVACPIPVRWRSAGARSGERGGKQLGARRYETVSRTDYEVGDDPRDIDWIASAQLGQILVAKDLEPRQIDVFALVDLKPTMEFGTTDTTKRALAAELVGALVKSANKTEDRIGLVAYSQHRLHLWRRPSSSRRALHNIVTDIIGTDATDHETVGSGLTKSLRSLPGQRSLVFVLSDFIALTNKEKVALRRASASHDVVCVIIEDERERSLPSGIGLYSLTDMLNGRSETIWLTKNSRSRYAANFERHRAALLADLKAAHCRTSIFSTAEDATAITKMILLFGHHRQ